MTTMSHGLYFSCNEPTALTLMIHCDAEFFHGPDVGAMVQFAGQNAVAASVAREKNDLAPGEFAGEQIVGRFAERRFDRHPFLVGEAFDVIKPGAADDADSMFSTWKIFNRETRETHEKKAGKPGNFLRLA